jgi:PIN domain nuclease of toxin-antitoxin system
MERLPVIALVDTHAVIWAIENDPRLGKNAAEFIGRAEPGSLGIADLTLLEIAILITKKRIGIASTPERFLHQIESVFHVYKLTAAIAQSAVELPLTHSDPFDRTIMATARYHKLPLITKDRLIVDSNCVETIW